MRAAPALLILALSAPLTAVAPSVGSLAGSPSGPAPVVLSEVRSTPAGDYGVQRPTSLRWDAEKGAVVAAADPTVKPSEALWPGSDVRLAWDDGKAGLLRGLAPGGDVVSTWDTSPLGVRSLGDVVVAPSSDQTDDPAATSVYLLDEGADSRGARVVETMAVEAAATVVSGSLVRTVRTADFSPPSPDPSGIAWLPDRDRLVISDGEVDEMTIFAGVNLFETTRAGVQTRNGVSQPWSDEPTGVAYIQSNQHLLVCDDDDKEVYDITAGPDGRFGSSDDTVTHFDTAGAGNTDTEGVAYDAATSSIWTVDGVNREVFRYQAGGDGRFGTADDARSNFDIGVYGALDPEGIDVDAVRDTIVVVDDKSDRILELDRAGGLLNSINTASIGMKTAAGVAVAPGSSNPSVRNYYVVARGVDNNTDPNENDGILYEIAAALPPTGGGGGGNQPPVVSAGADQSIALPSSATLDGSVTDDGQPSPSTLTATWSKVSGVGTVTFGDATALDTTASFSAAGSYVLRLTVSDGQAAGADDVAVTVGEAGTAVVVERAVAASSDDAEQSSSGAVSLTSSDLELVTEGTVVQTVGVRFSGLQVPPGATISRAWVQFRTDEVSTEPTSLVIRAEDADSTPTYQATSGNVTSRSLTSASVPWSPPTWDVNGAAGAAQRTPDLSALVQAVVGRAGWAQGNAFAVQFSGSGRRTAEAFDGSAAPLLHVEYGGGAPPPPPVNQAPVVSAGPDQSVLLPLQGMLNGTVTDDGLPTGTVTTAWTVVSGPGTVTFGNANAVDTTAAFSTAGSYVLRLAASDSELSAADELGVTVQPQGTPQVVAIPIRVSADDVEQRDGGGVQLSSSDLDLMMDGTRIISAVGLRFALDIPPGATIDQAYVQLRAMSGGTGASSFTVRAQAADTAPPFTSAKGSLTSRPVTAAGTLWEPPTWSAGSTQQTPDLTAVLQEVLGRAGWARGNAVALIVTGSGQRRASSFDGTTAPVLHIRWHL